MRICFVSDTHTKTHEMVHRIHPCDVLVHCGDFTFAGKFSQVKRFAKWLNQQPAKHKIVIAGNHDLSFESHHQDYQFVIPYLENNVENVHYLHNKSVDINGIKFYGSPYQPTFNNWAFNLPRMSYQLQYCWDEIPDDADVVVTHGPPYGVLDANELGKHCGCELLRGRLEKVNPMIHAFGHIHEGHGFVLEDGVSYINASICNEKYEPVNKPIYVDLIKRVEDGQSVFRKVDKIAY